MLSKTIRANETLDQDRFKNWYITAKPGEIYTYYIGFLGMENKSRFAMHIKHIAWEYAIKGRVYLFQRKMAENEFDYIAVKARHYTRQLVPFDYCTNRLQPVESEVLP